LRSILAWQHQRRGKPKTNDHRRAPRESRQEQLEKRTPLRRGSKFPRDLALQHAPICRMQFLRSVRLGATRLCSLAQQFFDWPFWVHRRVVQL
jgi:hypothetical protein